MTNEAKQLMNYIKEVIGIRQPEMPNYYRCLPVCIVDDIFSLQAHYETMTFPVVKRFADYFLNGEIYTDSYLIDDFIKDLDNVGLEKARLDVLKNSQKTGGRRKIDVCYEVAKRLQKMGIQTMQDFSEYPDKEYLAFSLHSIKGVGDAAVDYLFMMAGDNYRVKPDIHIHHCIRDAIGHDVSNEACQILFKEVSDCLMKELPYVTPRFLDGIVWNYYSKAKF